MKSNKEKPLVQIPNPCNEDWNKMQVVANGRNCLSCCKTVVDFSNMSNDEIIHYLAERKNEKVCGHFRNSQVYQNHEQHIFQHKSILTSNFKRIAAILLLSIGSLLSACKEAIVRNQPQAKNPIKDEEVKTVFTKEIIISKQPQTQKPTKVKRVKPQVTKPLINGKIIVSKTDSISEEKIERFVKGEMVMPVK
jgi:hypothetical protein